MLELYGEDSKFKDNELKTMTINTITLHLNQTTEQTLEKQ